MAESIEHIRHLEALLDEELRYERESYQTMLSRGAIAGQENVSWRRYPVEVKGWSRNALEQLVVDVTCDEGDGESDFEPGKAAAFFYIDNDGTTMRELPFTAFVDAASDTALRLALPNRAALASLQSHCAARLVGVQLALDITSYNVMQQALREVAAATDSRLVKLREVLAGAERPRFRSLPPVGLPWLNSEQQRAVMRVLEAQDVAIVHGPPGTGKTTTLVEAVIETLQRETQVLVCAPSNAAVDWISTQLHRRGVGVLRIGNPQRMTDEMLECSYERRYAAHPDYPELWNIRKTLREGSVKGQSHEVRQRLHQLRRRQTELEIRINDDLFAQASVVSATLIGSAYHILERRRFSTLFIDEAAQALEPACWAAIAKSDRVVLCGDHQQLPPTVKSPQAARNGLAVTMMQRLAKSKREAVSLLTEQYRMHRDIMEFPSRWFYHGNLRAAPMVADRLVSLMDTPLTWIDTAGCGFSEHEGGGTSRLNSEEARLVVHTVRDYIDTIGLERIVADNVDFGIITPYRAQLRMIRRLMKMQRYFRRLRGQISVNSVDGFQGQERDVIVISMVRDNDEGQLGFLGDLRRMNVAITRARMKLIIIGNSETLCRHPFYAALYEYIKERGQVLTPQPEPDPPLPQ